MKPDKNVVHAYAIVRVDLHKDPNVALDHRITVKVVMHDPEAARQEVERLNSLKNPERVHYFVQITRVQKQVVQAQHVKERPATTADGHVTPQLNEWAPPEYGVFTDFQPSEPGELQLN